jgi:hypothetical protein
MKQWVLLEPEQAEVYRMNCDAMDDVSCMIIIVSLLLTRVDRQASRPGRQEEAKDNAIQLP